MPMCPSLAAPPSGCRAHNTKPRGHIGPHANLGPTPSDPLWWYCGGRFKLDCPDLGINDQLFMGSLQVMNIMHGGLRFLPKVRGLRRQGPDGRGRGGPAGGHRLKLDSLSMSSLVGAWIGAFLTHGPVLVASDPASPPNPLHGGQHVPGKQDEGLDPAHPGHSELRPAEEGSRRMWHAVRGVYMCGCILGSSTPRGDRPQAAR